MTVLGVNFKKGEIRFTVLDGTKEKPVMIEKGAHAVITAPTTPHLLNWFETTFEELINRVAPDRIAYKLLLSPKKQQLEYISYPEAILNLVAYKRDVPIRSYTTLNFVGSKFGLTKSTDIYEHCDTVFGENPPKWDRDQKNSLLAAWLELPQGGK